METDTFANLLRYFARVIPQEIKTLPPKNVASKTVATKDSVDKQAPRSAGKKLPSNSVSSQRSASMSPNKKPSPLGSSPPINASDLQDGTTTSSSSSPLSSVGDDVSTPTPVSAYTSVPPNKVHKASANKESARPRYMPSDDDSRSPPLKRKASDHDHSEAPARKASKTLSSSSESSEPLIRRKITPGTTESASTKKSSDTRKRKADIDDEEKPQKVSKTSYASSVSSSGSSSSKDSLARRAADLQVSELDEKTVLLIKRFRESYARYQKLYSEVADNGPQSGEKFDAVLELHRKLETMKARISASIA